MKHFAGKLFCVGFYVSLTKNLNAFIRLKIYESLSILESTQKKCPQKCLFKEIAKFYTNENKFHS